MRKGDYIRVERRHSNLNGWSCRPDLHGAVLEILEVEDRLNGCITVMLPDGSRGLLFRDAVGDVIPKEKAE